MSKKIAKGLWINPHLAEEFDKEVRRLSTLMPGRLETGDVGAAALLTFLRLSDKEKLQALKDAKNYTFDRIIEQLPPDQPATTPDALRVIGEPREHNDTPDQQNPPTKGRADA